MPDAKLDLTAYDKDVVEHGLYGAARSRMFSDVTKGKAWQVALDKGAITFGGAPYRVQILGTHAAGDDSFLWGWANPGAASWAPSLEVAQTLRIMAEKGGRDVFGERKVAGSQVRLRELGWVVGELAGGRAAHFADAGGGTTVLLLVTTVPSEMDRFPLAYLPGVLLEFQAQTHVPMRPCVVRFLERLGFSVQAAKAPLNATRADGSTVSVDFDDQGRLGAVRMNLVPTK